MGNPFTQYCLIGEQITNATNDKIKERKLVFIKLVIACDK